MELGFVLCGVAEEASSGGVEIMSSSTWYVEKRFIEVVADRGLWDGQQQ